MKTSEEIMEIQEAYVLAELVRLERARHRPIAGDSAVAEHVKVVARAHQSLVAHAKAHRSS